MLATMVDQSFIETLSAGSLESSRNGSLTIPLTDLFFMDVFPDIVLESVPSLVHTTGTRRASDVLRDDLPNGTGNVIIELVLDIAYSSDNRRLD